MEDTGVETFLVEIILNGNTESFEFQITPTTTIDNVKKEMRESCNVTGGTLSSCSDRPVVVNRLVAGGVYYFIKFTPLQVQGAMAANVPSEEIIAIPSVRPWRSLDKPCPFLNSGKCPRDKLVDVDNAVDMAVGIVAQYKDEAERVPPIVISRVYRGGKTTLIDLIAKKLSEVSEYYVITVSTNGGFHRRKDESWCRALVRLIAYQLVEQDTVRDSDNMFYCKDYDLLDHLQEINDQGKTVILLIDELNKMGVPLDDSTSSFLTKHFLDKKGRYLIFSSHIQFAIDSPELAPAVASNCISSPSGRNMLTLPLPFCTDRTILQKMVESEVTDLAITLAVGIPSLLYVMSKPSRDEMSFQQRFDDVIKRHLNAGRNSRVEREFVETHKAALLDDFLWSIISGDKCGRFFEVFSTPVDQGRLRYPLPYIPIILQFLEENDGVLLFESLIRSADTVESGRDWELVVTFSIYLRSLASKHCTRRAGQRPLRGPFDIATEGVEDVKVTTIPAEVHDVARAMQYIQEKTEEAKTIYIFQLAFSRFPVFDGFVSYRRLKRRAGEDDSPTIHGYQCKLSRGYPVHGLEAYPNIARGWFLRGGTTVRTPDRDGWVFPSVEEINTNLLGFGLQLLHPMTWGDVTPPRVFR